MCRFNYHASAHLTNTFPLKCVRVLFANWHVGLIENVMHAHSFINFWLHKPCHTQHKPIFIVIHKFIRPSAISTLGSASRFSQNGQPIPAQPSFHTLYKIGQCSPKHNYFQIFWCHYIKIAETFSHPYIWKFLENDSHFFYLRDYSKLSTLLRHSVESLPLI